MKMMRDPLYGDIFVSYSDVKLIDTEVIQRLKGVSQLGTLRWVYPGATHSRFEHSIGVLHLATVIAKQLLSKELYNSCRDTLSAACLFHDSGHPPFSHTLEEYQLPLKSHEEQSAALAKSTIESLSDIEISGDEVSDILLRKKGCLSDIISGSLDADRLDYLRRDALHTGVTYGIIDTRIMSLFRLWKEKLAIDKRAVVPGETVLFARYVMRAILYDHKVARSIGGMIGRAVECAMEESNDNRSPIEENELISLKEDQFLWRIKECGSIPEEISKRLETRNILKLAGVTDMKQLEEEKSVNKINDMTNEKKVIIQNKLANELGLRSFEVFIDKPNIDRYIIKEGKIPVCTSGKSCGTLLETSDLAAHINDAHQSLWKVRLFVPEQHTAIGRKKFEHITGIKLLPPQKSPIKRDYINL